MVVLCRDVTGDATQQQRKEFEVCLGLPALTFARCLTVGSCCACQFMTLSAANRVFEERIRHYVVVGLTMIR